LVARLFVIEQRDLPKYGLESIKDQEARESGVEAEVEEEVEELSLFGVIKALGSNRRGMTGVMMTAIFGLVDGALDPTYVEPAISRGDRKLTISLTLRVSEVWHKDSDFIGLIYRMSPFHSEAVLTSSNGSHSSILHWPPLWSPSGQIWIRIRNAPNVVVDDTLVGPIIA
jgi:hypothetical protein